MKLEKGTPRHEQISSFIRGKIETGAYKTDEKLPSENEFKKQFGVSRVTVRRALQTLENEDLIYRCQGVGSFVKSGRPHQTFSQLTDFVKDMKRAGMEASSHVMQLKTMPVPANVASVLKVKPGSTVVRLDRLRLGDAKPIAFDITWLPMFYGQLIENYDLGEETIYGILEQEYEIPIEKGRYHIEAANADEYLARHLDVKNRHALLLIDRLSLTFADKPVYYQKSYYRTDRMVYQLIVEHDENTRKNAASFSDFSPVFNIETND